MASVLIERRGRRGRRPVRPAEPVAADAAADPFTDPAVEAAAPDELPDEEGAPEPHRTVLDSCPPRWGVVARAGPAVDGCTAVVGGVWPSPRGPDDARRVAFVEDRPGPVDGWWTVVRGGRGEHHQADELTTAATQWRAPDGACGVGEQACKRSPT
jgi:hypothetical protein